MSLAVQPKDNRSCPVVQAGKRKTFGKGGNKQKNIMGPVSYRALLGGQAADGQMTKGIKLSYSMASEAPDLSEFDLYPMVRCDL